MEIIYFFGGLLCGAIGTAVAIALFQMVRDRDLELRIEDDLYSYEFAKAPCKHHAYVDLQGISVCSICGGTG